MPRPKLEDIEHQKTKKLAKQLRNNVVRLLEESGWTMLELADRSNLALGTIQEISQGKMTNPRLQTIVDLSDGFGIKDPLDLFRK